jgi:putative tricarboxylic transport membrane protein
LDTLGHLWFGFSIVLKPEILLCCFTGVLLGTLTGVLPGIGCAAAVALLLPFTFNLSPVASIVMLSGIFYGSMYGGSTTSILVNIPGEASSVVTCLDGYEMARQGRAGPALGMAAFGSVIAGTFGVILTMLIAPFLAETALRFSYPEFFSLILAGMTMVSFLAQGSKVKAFMAAALGIMMATIGHDPIKGVERFTLGFTTISDGLGFIPVVMGIFGIPEILENIEIGLKRTIHKSKIEGLLPSRKDWKESGGAITRGTLVGFFLGLFPGVGGMLPTFASYALEKRISKNPEQFGKGAIAGVAGPETANNAGAAGSFIPLLTLGIPTNAVMAMLLSALMIQGIQIGPLLIEKHPDIFWGLIASMYVGNVMLLLLNLPLIGIWVRVLSVPYRLLFPMIILFTLIGSFSVNNNKYDILVMVIMGCVGYLMRKFGYEAAPLILGFILGSMFEKKLRQSLLYAGGDPWVFLSRPISAFFVLVAAFFVISAVISAVSGRGKARAVEERAMSSERGDLGSGMVMLGLAIVFGWGAMELGLGSPRNPDPGFFPFLLGMVLSLLSVFLIGKTFLRKGAKEIKRAQWHGPHFYRGLAVVIALFLYVFVLEPLGYITATFLLMFFLFKAIEPQKWRVSLSLAVLAAWASYGFFKLLLHVPLPRGTFGF